jgi:hypothetical protein
LGLFGVLYWANPNILRDSVTPDSTAEPLSILPLYVFYALAAVIVALAIAWRWSLIPVLGLLLNLFMMSQVMFVSWSRFLYWMVLGVVVYGLYGYWHSKLAKGNKGIK